MLGECVMSEGHDQDGANNTDHQRIVAVSNVEAMLDLPCFVCLAVELVCERGGGGCFTLEPCRSEGH